MTRDTPEAAAAAAVAWFIAVQSTARYIIDKQTISSPVAVIADRAAYDVRYTGKLSNRFRLQV